MVLDEGRYHFIFNRRQSDIDPSQYIVETSTTLEPDDWEKLVPDEARTTPHSTLGGFDRVVVPLLVNTPRRIVRLQIR